MRQRVVQLLLLLTNLLSDVHLQPACRSHDQPCIGAHGSQGNCCAGTYCHKSNPSWAEGRCYFSTGADAGLAAPACISFDGACVGANATSGNCCANLYCHKANPTWAEGRCYHIQSSDGSIVATAVVGAAPPVIRTTCVNHDGECYGAHATQGDCCANLYCHKSNPTWASGRCYHVTAPVATPTSFVPPPPVVSAPLPAVQSGPIGSVVMSNSRPPIIAVTSHSSDSGTVCVPVGGECVGDPGTRGDCCPKTYCHKDDYSWARGRCRTVPVI